MMGASSRSSLLKGLGIAVGLLILLFIGGIIWFMSVMGDPSHPIHILNETSDTLSVKAYRSVHFHNDDVEIKDGRGNYLHRWISFEVPPRSAVECGMAISGNEDEMPFTDLVVTKAAGDSIVAHGEKEVLGLFDRGVFGGLETPYVIRIR